MECPQLLECLASLLSLHRPRLGITDTLVAWLTCGNSGKNIHGETVPEARSNSEAVASAEPLWQW